MRIDIDLNNREILLINLALDQLKRKGVWIGPANEQWSKDLEELIEKYEKWLKCV